MRRRYLRAPKVASRTIGITLVFDCLTICFRTIAIIMTVEALTNVLAAKHIDNWKVHDGHSEVYVGRAER